MGTKIKPADLRDRLIEEGRYFVTSAELCDMLGVAPHSLHGSLHRPKERLEISNVCPGGWVPTPVEYQTGNEHWDASGIPPMTWYLDSMMSHLGHKYYIGHNTAAKRWGMAHHHSPLTFVVTTARTSHRTKKRKGAAYRWSESAKYVHSTSIDSKTLRAKAGSTSGLPEGVSVLYSSPETTYLDLVQSAKYGPAVDRACDAACKLLIRDGCGFGAIDVEAIAEEALKYPVSVRQRAGRLLDAAASHTGFPVDSAPLAETLPTQLSQIPLFREGDRWPILYDRPTKNTVHLPWKVEDNGFLDPDA